jgi:hypothetical protein
MRIERHIRVIPKSSDGQLPRGIAASNKYVYVAERGQICRLPLTDIAPTSSASTLPAEATSAAVFEPFVKVGDESLFLYALCVDKQTEVLYVFDDENCIHRITPGMYCSSFRISKCYFRGIKIGVEC